MFEVLKKRNADRAKHPFEMALSGVIDVLVTGPVVLILVQMLFNLFDYFGWSLVFTADGLLGFLGSVVAAAAAFIVLVITLADSRDARDEERRSDVSPCLAFDILDRGYEETLVPYATAKLRDNMSKGVHSYAGLTVARPLNDEPFKRCFAVIGDDETVYPRALEEEQLSRINQPLIGAELSDGIKFFETNTALYLPLRFRSLGIGAAVDLAFSVVKCDSDDEIPRNRLKSTEVFQLVTGEFVCLGIYAEDLRRLASEEGYWVIASYRDVLGHKYRQATKLRVVVDETGKVEYRIDYSMKQIRIDG